VLRHRIEVIGGRMRTDGFDGFAGSETERCSEARRPRRGEDRTSE